MGDRVTVVRRWGTLAALAGLALGAVTGCSGAPAEELSATPSVTSVSVEDVSTALSSLIVDDGVSHAADSCIADVLAEHPLKASANAMIVTITDDEDSASGLAELVVHLMDADEADAAQTLADSEIRAGLLECQADALGVTGEPADVEVYAAPATAANPPQDPAPDLTPRVAIDSFEKSRIIEGNGIVTEGVVSLMTSFAVNDDQREAYAQAGECFSTAVTSSGLSPRSQLTIAGGPRMGAGSVTDILATDEDVKIWSSQTFQLQLRKCIVEAEASIAADKEAQAEKDALGADVIDE